MLSPQEKKILLRFIEQTNYVKKGLFFSSDTRRDEQKVGQNKQDESKAIQDLVFHSQAFYFAQLI